MTDLHTKPIAITKSDLKLIFPQTRAIAIAASAVSKNEQMIGIGIVIRSGFLPPGTDGVYGKLGGITACSHAYKPLITAKVIDTIRDGHALSVGRKIMIKNLDGVLSSICGRVGETVRSAHGFWYQC